LDGARWLRRFAERRPLSGHFTAGRTLWTCRWARWARPGPFADRWSHRGSGTRPVLRLGPGRCGRGPAFASGGCCCATPNALCRPCLSRQGCPSQRLSTGGMWKRATAGHRVVQYSLVRLWQPAWRALTGGAGARAAGGPHRPDGGGEGGRSTGPLGPRYRSGASTRCPCPRSPAAPRRSGAGTGVAFEDRGTTRTHERGCDPGESGQGTSRPAHCNAISPASAQHSSRWCPPKVYGRFEPRNETTYDRDAMHGPTVTGKKTYPGVHRRPLQLLPGLPLDFFRDTVHLESALRPGTRLSWRAPAVLVDNGQRICQRPVPAGCAVLGARVHAKPGAATKGKIESCSGPSGASSRRGRGRGIESLRAEHAFLCMGEVIITGACTPRPRDALERFMAPGPPALPSRNNCTKPSCGPRQGP